MPWVIFLLVFLIYVSFYFYDKCVLFQDVYAVCFRGSIQKEENNAAAYVQKHLDEQFGRKYFGTGSVLGNVEKSGKHLNVYGMCGVKVPFVFFSSERWQILAKAEAQISNPTKIIRRCRMAENIAQGLAEGASQISSE